MPDENDRARAVQAAHAPTAVRGVTGHQLDDVARAELDAGAVRIARYRDRSHIFRSHSALPVRRFPSRLRPASLTMMPQVLHPSTGPEHHATGITPTVCRNHRHKGITLAMRFNLEGRPCIS
jgi:hypothetical protein